MPEQSLRRFMPDIPPPPFAQAYSVVRDALPVLQAARRIDVPEWAAQSRRIVTPNFQGPWRNDFAPYMTEPARMFTSRAYGALVFVGPARTAKSEALILNPIGHAIECKPRDLLVVCQTKDKAKDFSEKKLAPMLRANRNLSSRQLTGRGADNIHEKKFDGGMSIQIGWPVIGFFSQNEYFTVLLTDRDRMPDDVDGEGDPFLLARKRVQQAGSLGMVVSESSPGRPILDDEWKPATLHEAPPCGGILSEYNLGTRGRFYWDCPHCHEAFRPEFACLHWEEKATDGETAKTVFMACPNGCVIGPDRKNELNAKGVWLHEANDGQSLVEIDDPAIRDTDVASWWCEGPVAAMQSWDQLVLRDMQARSVFKATGDETSLKATVTLDQGRPHLPMVRTVGEGLSEETLKAMTGRFQMQVAPAETRFITLQVDVQPNRFVVSAEACGPGLECWLIDRFDIANPPEGAPGSEADKKGNPRRAIDPGRYGEDWEALRPLFERSYPVAGTRYAMLPRAMIVDSGGAPGTTANAYAFYRRMRRDGFGKRFFLLKGIGGTDKQRAVYEAPEKVLGVKQKRVTDIRIVKVGTDPLKDEVALALTRKEPGPGAYHIPDTLEETHIAEFCAEIRTEKGWQPKKSGIRNESLDLAVYARALRIVLKAEKMNWDNALPWARPAEENNYAVVRTETPVEAAEPAAAVRKQRRRRVLSKGI